MSPRPNIGGVAGLVAGGARIAASAATASSIVGSATAVSEDWPPTVAMAATTVDTTAHVAGGGAALGLVLRQALLWVAWPAVRLTAGATVMIITAIPPWRRHRSSMRRLPPPSS